MPKMISEQSDGWGENLRWFPPYSISVFRLRPGSDPRSDPDLEKWREKVTETNASQWDTCRDFKTQRCPKLIYLGGHFDTFWGNLDLFILATPLVRKHCFRDLEEVGICSFRWLFQRWFQDGFQRRTFRDLGEFRCQIWTQFGVP